MRGFRQVSGCSQATSHLRLNGHVPSISAYHCGDWSQYVGSCTLKQSLYLMIYSGVGFGICQRLLLQLSQSSPPDAYPPFEASFGSQEREGDAFPLPCEGLTLIMACRSLPRAEAARTKLYNCLDSDIARRQKSPDFDSHAISFRKNLTIEVHVVDLANLTTIFKFAEDIAHQFVASSSFFAYTLDIASQDIHISHM